MWNRYNVISTYHWDYYRPKVTSYTLVEDRDSSTYEAETSISYQVNASSSTTAYLNNTLYKSYSFDTSKGEIVLSDAVDLRYSASAMSWGTIYESGYCYAKGSKTYIYKVDYVRCQIQYTVSRHIFVFMMPSNSQYPFTLSEVYGPGTYVGSVSDTNSSKYPVNGISGSYYYSRGQTTYSVGSYIDQVTSTNSGQYPSNGQSGSYWYISNGSQQIKGSLVGTVTSYDSAAYPDDGIQDGYWYVKV